MLHSPDHIDAVQTFFNYVCIPFIHSPIQYQIVHKILQMIILLAEWKQKLNGLDPYQQDEDNLSVS